MAHLLTALGYLLPALALLALLALRRYPGERALLAAIERRRPVRRPRPCGARSLHPRPRARLPRGGGLIASSLAVRPPPETALAAR